MHIEECAAGVALIQGGVGLQQGHAAALVADVPGNGGNDAVGEGAAEGVSQGVADGGHRVPHPEAGALSELRGNEILCFDLQHGEVADGIGTDELCFKLPVIMEGDGGPVAAVHHMGIGQDQPIGSQNDAGAPVVAALPVHEAGNGHNGGSALFIELLQRKLRAGDAFQLQADIPHRIAALDLHIGAGRVRLLVIAFEKLRPVLRHDGIGLLVFFLCARIDIPSERRILSGVVPLLTPVPAPVPFAGGVRVSLRLGRGQGGLLAIAQLWDGDAQDDGHDQQCCDEPGPDESAGRVRFFDFLGFGGGCSFRLGLRRLLGSIPALRIIPTHIFTPDVPSDSLFFYHTWQEAA